MTLTFPSISPDLNNSPAREPKILRADFGDGYLQAAGDGINPHKDTWDLSFTSRPKADIQTIADFLDGLNGSQSFYWTPPGETNVNVIASGDFVAGAYKYNGQVVSLTDATTLVRGSNKYAVDVNGNFDVYAVNELAIQPTGAFVEIQAQNVALYSSQFDNAVWLKSTTSITVNATAAPDGTLTADRLTATGVDSAVGQQSSLSYAIGTTLTASMWLRADANTTIRFYIINGTQLTFITVNLTTAWQRFSVSQTWTVAGAAVIQVGGAGSFPTGAVVYAWGGQLELGARASSYIPTVASQTIRLADALKLDNASGKANWTVSLKNGTVLSYPNVDGALNIDPNAIATGALNILSYQATLVAALQKKWFQTGKRVGPSKSGPDAYSISFSIERTQTP